MSVQKMKLYGGTLGINPATLYTAALNAGEEMTVTEIIVANTTASATAVTITIGGQKVVPGKSIPANDAIIISLRTELSNGDTITGVAGTANAIDVKISGIKITP